VDGREEHPQPPEDIVYRAEHLAKTGRTTPLTHRAKALMTLSALMTLRELLAVSTIALVFARAVNLLR
jgi:hypothetical protein